MPAQYPVASWVTDFLTANPEFAATLCERGTDCSDCANRTYNAIPYEERVRGERTGGQFYTNRPYGATTYHHCRICELPVASEEMRLIYRRNGNGGERVCRPCVIAGDYVSCGECGNHVPSASLTRVGGDTYCEDCVDRCVGDCEVCGETCTNVYTDMDDERRFYCNRHVAAVWRCDDCCYWNLPGVQDCGCDREDGENDGPAIHSYHDGPHGSIRYHALVKDAVLPVVRKDDDRRLFLGVELEIESLGGEPRAKLARRLCKAIASWCERDGSLSGNGFEWITHPHTFAALRHHKDAITQALADVRGMGGRSYNTTTCGLHIHASRAAFQGTAHVFKLLALIYHNPRVILKLSQRHSFGAMETYATLGESITKLPSKAKSGPDAWHRYCAINLNPEHTVEFRFFKGTLNPASFYRAIEFVDASIEWTRNIPLDDARSFKLFREYVQKFSKRYPELHKWLTASDTKEARDA